MRRGLKGSFEVHYERVIYSLQDLFLRLNMFNLFQSDDLTFLQALESQRFRLGWLALVFHQAYSAKGPSTESGQKFEVIQLEFTLLLSS